MSSAATRARTASLQPQPQLNPNPNQMMHQHQQHLHPTAANQSGGSQTHLARREPLGGPARSLGQQHGQLDPGGSLRAASGPGNANNNNTDNNNVGQLAQVADNGQQWANWPQAAGSNHLSGSARYPKSQMSHDERLKFSSSTPPGHNQLAAIVQQQQLAGDSGQLAPGYALAGFPQPGQIQRRCLPAQPLNLAEPRRDYLQLEASQQSYFFEQPDASSPMFLAGQRALKLTGSIDNCSIKRSEAEPSQASRSQQQHRLSAGFLVAPNESQQQQQQQLINQIGSEQLDLQSRHAALEPTRFGPIQAASVGSSSSAHSSPMKQHHHHHHHHRSASIALQGSQQRPSGNLYASELSVHGYTKLARDSDYLFELNLAKNGSRRLNYEPQPYLAANSDAEMLYAATDQRAASIGTTDPKAYISTGAISRQANYFADNKREYAIGKYYN